MLCWLKCIGSSSVYLLYLSSSPMRVSRLSDPSGVQPTEVEAKSQKFHGAGWLCLDTFRPPVLFSNHSLPFSFGETPNPKSDILQQTGTSLWQEPKVKVKGRDKEGLRKGTVQLRGWGFWMYCNSCTLFYCSLFFFFLATFFNKDIFLSGKNERGESINSWGGTWNVV